MGPLPVPNPEIFWGKCNEGGREGGKRKGEKVSYKLGEHILIY